MNSIKGIPAQGAPGSLTRLFQERPEMAIELLSAVKATLSDGMTFARVEYIKSIVADIELARIGEEHK